MTDRSDILARKDGASLPFPPDPIAAVRHADPYPYYADLLAKKPLYRDAALGVWVASSAEAATAVLTRLWIGDFVSMPGRPAAANK